MAKQSSEDQGPISPTSSKVKGGVVKNSRTQGQPKLSTLNDQGVNKLQK